MKPMNNLSTRVNNVMSEKKKALSFFVTAGFPTLEITVPLVVELAKAGADVIELGIPFSDPVADGPIIQASSEIALRNGITLNKTLEMARQIRQQSDVPLVFMGYANPIFSMGLENFLSSCHAIGIDGVIIPDLPLEESEEYRMLAKQNNVSTIFLAAPTTSNERLKLLDEASTGFLYCVSVTGVTGERQQISIQAKEFLTRARTCVKNNPLFVGFGISTPEDAQQIAQYADGIIIGSALVKILQNAPLRQAVSDAVTFVKSIRKALAS
ncbi:MAG: tryptophan synthase subunit alpha [Bacteroidetes bacterium]|nr:MAG: tryptophan synthase subunit alpha [Bacteroidota bacterium]